MNSSKVDKLPKLFVAFDFDDESAIFDMLHKTQLPANIGIKLNLDLILKDVNCIHRIKTVTKLPIFADLKIWNGKRTMVNVIREIARQGADVINVHALAGELLGKTMREVSDLNVKVVAVTILTHYDDKYCREHFGTTMSEEVSLLTEEAVLQGCHGVVLAGTCLEAIKEVNCLKIVPAIRPEWFEDKNTNLQKSIVTPKQAFDAGATSIVVGSPIWKSENPSIAIQMILDEIERKIPEWNGQGLA